MILGFFAPIRKVLRRGSLVNLIQFLDRRRHLQERWEAEEPDLLNQIECFIEVSSWHRIDAQDREGKAAVPHCTHIAHFEDPFHWRHRFVVIIIVLAAVNVAPLEPSDLLLCLIVSLASDEVLHSCPDRVDVAFIFKLLLFVVNLLRCGLRLLILIGKLS